MKIKTLAKGTILAVSIIAICASGYFFKYFSDLQAPSFSAEAGFYDEPFYLEIAVDQDADIYYTLDGSDPSKDGIPYKEPIYLQDPSDQPNQLSARTDLSAAFFAEPDRFAVPTELVDKANIIRAVAISKDGNEVSPIASATYWIGGRMSVYKGVHVISLVTDPANLFDYETGIYVSGKTFDTFVADVGMSKLSSPENWRRWEANYMNHGRDWERPCHFDYIDPEGVKISSDEVGLRIKGNSSRAITKKSFKLFAREEYSGKNTFAVPFLDEYGRSKIALFGGAQDYRTLMYDAIVAHATQGLDFAVMQSKPCYLFLDGEYWGFYWITETISEEYLAEHYFVPKEDVVVYKDGSTTSAGEGVDDCVAELEALFDDQTPVDDEVYRSICEKIDIASFIDYYAAEIYIDRGLNEWPKHNEALWRSKKKLDLECCDGKWRWMLYDTNWACLSAWDNESIEYTINKSNLFRRLMEYKPFRERFLDRLEGLSKKEFDPVLLAPQFEFLCNMLRDPVKKDLKKYYGDNRGPDDFEKEVNSLAEFLQNRPGYIQDLIKKYR